MSILNLLRSKNNSTLSVITMHHSDLFSNKHDCTYVLNSAESTKVTKETCIDAEYIFSEFDELLLQDDVTYQINVLPTLSLIIRTKDEEYTISSHMLYNADIFVNDKSIINSPSKILTKIIKREAIPVKIIIKYENIKDTTTTRSYKENASDLTYRQKSAMLNNPVQVTEFVKTEVKPKGYTNVIVGNEVELDPDKHRNKIIAEVMQHVENVAKGEVHASEPNKTLEDVRIHDDSNVPPAEVEAYRKKIFNEGLQELAKEARRKEEQSTEDDFSV